MQHHLELNPLCPFSCLFFTVLIFCRIFCMFCIFIFILHVETSFWRLLVDIIVQVMLCNFDQAAICAVSESSGNIHVYWFCRMLSAWFSQVSPVTQRNCLLRKHFFLWKMFPTCWWYLFWWMVKVTCVFSDYKQWLTSLVRPSLQCISYSSGGGMSKVLIKRFYICWEHSKFFFSYYTCVIHWITSTFIKKSSGKLSLYLFKESVSAWRLSYQKCC